MNAREWFYGSLGFGSTRGSFPVTGSTVKKTDAAMARTAKGLCIHCGKATDEDGRCVEKCQEAR